MLSGACLGLVCIGVGLQTFLGGDHQRRRLPVSATAVTAAEPLLHQDMQDEDLWGKFLRESQQPENKIALTLGEIVKTLRVKKGADLELLAIKPQKCTVWSKWRIREEVEFVGLVRDANEEFQLQVKAGWTFPFGKTRKAPFDSFCFRSTWKKYVDKANNKEFTEQEDSICAVVQVEQPSDAVDVELQRAIDYKKAEAHGLIDKVLESLEKYKIKRCFIALCDLDMSSKKDMVRELSNCSLEEISFELPDGCDHEKFYAWAKYIMENWKEDTEELFVKDHTDSEQRVVDYYYDIVKQQEDESSDDEFKVSKTVYMYNDEEANPDEE